MTAAQPRFGTIWARGAGPRPMVVAVMVPPVLRGARLRLVGCRAFTWGPSVYDMMVVANDGRIVPFTAQGERGLAAVSVQGRRYYVHRLVAFNALPSPHDRGRSWGNSQRLRWGTSEVHHYADPLRPQRPPWADSRRRNMIVWSAAAHRAWHRARPGVPHL